MRITASLMFDHKNICGKLKLFACHSEVFDVAQLKCHIEVKKSYAYRFQEWLKVYMPLHVWQIQLMQTVAANKVVKCIVTFKPAL